MAARSRRKASLTRVTDPVKTGSTKVNATASLQLADVLCCVCRGVLVEPVSLPCRHRFCRACWLATDALRCPLCRKRVGSWLRASVRRNHLVDEELWRIIRDQFPDELANKLNGIDVELPVDVPAPRLSAPGEIRAEYEEELQRLRAERQQLEESQQRNTELLAQKLQKEEEEMQKLYLEKLKQDEELAKQLQATENKSLVTRVNGTLRPTTKVKTKSTKKRATIDRYLVKKAVQEEIASKPCRSPLITDNDTSGGSGGTASAKKQAPPAQPHQHQPAPGYGRFFKDYLDKKLRHLTGSMLHNQSTATVKTWVPPTDSKDESAQKEFSFEGTRPPLRTKGAQKELCPAVPSTSNGRSMPVSLPYSGILNKSVAALESVSARSKHRTSVSSDSVDSMKQELCYFKPIHPSGSTSRSKIEAREVLRVPTVRVTPRSNIPEPTAHAPDYLEGLIKLRGTPSTCDTASAFVCFILQGDAAKYDICEVKLKTDNETHLNDDPPGRHSYSFRKKPTDCSKDTESRLLTLQRLRRTRSTGNIPKLIDESTPKKPNSKKRTASERKLKSKSEGKKPDIVVDCVDLKRVNLVTKNLSSPFEICNMISDKEICKKEAACDYGYIESNNNHSTVRKSARITWAACVNGTVDADESLSVETAVSTQQKRLEQEKQDLELALRVEAEWNGGYALRGASTKRVHALQHPLMIARAKKMKA